MSDSQHQKFNSRAVHAGYHAKCGPVNPPIEESSTYAFASCDDGAERFAGKAKEGIYSRLSSPTVRALEKKLAELEHGFDGIATASGMAAVTAVYYHYLQAGSHVIATASMYGPSRTIIEDKRFFGKWGVSASLLDTSDIDQVRKAIRPDTRLIYVETPANPTLAISDLAAITALAREHELPVAVDNTFCSPYLQNPLELGADVVLHSMTKSIGGHANAVGGMIVTKDEATYHPLRSVVINLGGILSPHDAGLFFNGVKTLGVRMATMQANAVRIADYLRTHPKIAWVVYPGHESHPKHALVAGGRQMRGPGAMMSFGVKGGLSAAKTLLDNVGLITLAVSLGGVESLMESPALMTHAGVPRAEREKAGISDELVRLSIGIEDCDDLIADLDQALAKVDVTKPEMTTQDS